MKDTLSQKLPCVHDECHLYEYCKSHRINLHTQTLKEAGNVKGQPDIGFVQELWYAIHIGTSRFQNGLTEMTFKNTTKSHFLKQA